MLRQVESGVPVKEFCRKLQISEQTLYRWKKKFGGLGVAEVRRLKQLAIHCPDSDACFYVRNDEVEGSTIVLRTEPPRNSQRLGVKPASQYTDPNRLFDSVACPES